MSGYGTQKCCDDIKKIEVETAVSAFEMKFSFNPIETQSGLSVKLQNDAF